MSDVLSATLSCHVMLTLQGLDDHAHKPTLERLPKNKLVVGSPAAAAVARQLGFSNVISLDHGQKIKICCDQLELEAFAGVSTVLICLLPVAICAITISHACKGC